MVEKVCLPLAAAREDDQYVWYSALLVIAIPSN
jgi:hypothetical protein